MRPLAIDLFCGFGGWAEGLLAEGWDVVGVQGGEVMHECPSCGRQCGCAEGEAWPEDCDHDCDAADDEEMEEVDV